MSQLPKNWILCRLGDVMRLKNGFAFKSGDYASEGVSLVRISDIQDSKVSLDNAVKIPEEKTNADFFVSPGDLLIAMSGATTGKTGVYLGSTPCLQNQRVGNFKIIVTDVLVEKYRNFFVESLRKDIEQAAYGGAQPNISSSSIEDFQFPLAPLNEQTRIVAEIEKQFSRLDEAVANLKRVKANLKRYKSAVLKAAVEGKLTEEWRLQHPDVEPADKLLVRILAERRKSAGKGKYKGPVGPDTSGLSELPAGWVWVSVGAIAFVTKLAGFEYTKFVKYDPDGDLHVLKAENAGREGFKWTDFSRIKSETVSLLTRSKLKPGDLLMVFVGAGTGNVAHVPDDRPYFLGPNIAMMRVGLSQVMPRYVELYLRSPTGNALALGYAKAVAQPSLSMETIRLIPLALPSLAEQNQIVTEVERCLTIVANAEIQVDANLRRADRLRQSILKQAFSGQLVPQDPNDEPASVLLGRIRSNASVGADRVRPERVTSKTGASVAPLRKPRQQTEPAPAVSDKFACLDDVTAAILALMQPGREYVRADLADPLGLSTSRWNVAIQDLKRQGKVRQLGEKRGARYVRV